MQFVASFNAQAYTGGTALAQPFAAPSPLPQLAQPMTLTLSYDNLPAGVTPATLTLMWFNPASKSWENLPATLNTTAHTLSAQTLHLGEFVLAGGLRETFLPLMRH